MGKTTCVPCGTPRARSSFASRPSNSISTGKPQAPRRSQFLPPHHTHTHTPHTTPPPRTQHHQTPTLLACQHHGPATWPVSFLCVLSIIEKSLKHWQADAPSAPCCLLCILPHL